MKVPTGKLIELVEKRLATTEQEEAAEKAQAEKAFDNWRKEMLAKLPKATSKAELPSQPYSYSDSTRKVASIKSDLQLLKLCSEETVSVTSTSNFFRYL